MGDVVPYFRISPQREKGEVRAVEKTGSKGRSDILEEKCYTMK